MQASGFSVVRVFTNGCCCGVSAVGPDGKVSPAYLANLVDFLNRARIQGIYVLLTGDGMPRFGSYWTEQAVGQTNQFAADNAFLLTAPGVSAYRRFWSDLVDCQHSLTAWV